MAAHPVAAARAFELNAVVHRDAVQPQPAQVIDALGEHLAVSHQGRHGRELVGEAGGVEHGDDLRAGLRILIGDQVQQRAGAGEHDPLADRAALVLQRDLRRAQRVDAGQGPARERQYAVGRAGGDDQLAIGHAVRSGRGTAGRAGRPRRSRPASPAGSRSAPGCRPWRRARPRRAPPRSRTAPSSCGGNSPAAGGRSGRPSAAPRRSPPAARRGGTAFARRARRPGRRPRSRVAALPS